ncbi:MAG: hypothetical protein E7320_11155 [Clostridiales bacterium]|nr:hypothetical protein [Clostridiales bacterium]
MTLDAAKALLKENHISFSELHFDSVAEFRMHLSPFAYTENAGECPVKALVVASNNNHKNIELQFVDENNCGNYSFVDLYFGEYFFELFDCPEECLQQSIVDEIKRIISNEVIVIVANDLKKGKWVGDQIFAKNEKDGLGLPGFERTMQRLNKKKGFVAKIIGTKTQYEIYDWNSYQCMIM